MFKIVVCTLIDQICAVPSRLVPLHQFAWRDQYGYAFFQGQAMAMVLFLAACAPVEKQPQNLDESLTNDRANEIVRVYAKVTLKDVTQHPVGINLNYLMDDDALLNPEKGIVESLKALGVKYLRYPGGEMSDSYLWTIPPWPNSSTDGLKPMLARTGTNEWPSNTKFTIGDKATLIPEVLDFDEFMSICAAIQCEPVIVVAADSPYVPSRDTGKIPTRQQLIESAVEWVRYANLTRGYGIKYWMIGNETWLVGYNGGTDAKTYARDLIDFSVAMRSVDPSIRIIANGNSEGWWKEILGTASEYIDYLGVSNYPLHDWAGFETYQVNDVELDRAVKIAISAIEKYAPSRDSHRLQVVVSETNAIDWNKSGWKNHNDLGHALVLFQMVGDLLLQEKVAFIHYWTTRWVDAPTWEFPRVYNAIDQDGRLEATGLALAIWGNYLLDAMVSTMGGKSIKVFATLSRKSNQLNLFLVNKESNASPVSIEIKGHDSVATVVRKSLLGTGPEDTHPGWWTGTVELTDQRIEMTLPAVSITVLEIPVDSATLGASLR
jgi:hypothetical protein